MSPAAAFGFSSVTTDPGASGETRGTFTVNVTLKDPVGQTDDTGGNKDKIVLVVVNARGNRIRTNFDKVPNSLCALAYTITMKFISAIDAVDGS